MIYTSMLDVDLKNFQRYQFLCGFICKECTKMIKIFLKIKPHRNAVASKLKFLQPVCSLSRGNCVSVSVCEGVFVIFLFES